MSLISTVEFRKVSVFLLNPQVGAAGKVETSQAFITDEGSHADSADLNAPLGTLDSPW